MVLDDFPENEADENRLTEGILVKDMTKDLVFEDGAMMTFGNSHDVEVYIPLDDLDTEQFTLYNRNGLVYLVDKGNQQPTYIQCQKDTKYRIQIGDYINFGLAAGLEVVECRSQNPPVGDRDGFQNIRYVTEDVSKTLAEDLTNPEHVGQPTLKLEYKIGDRQGQQIDFDPSKVSNIGR